MDIAARRVDVEGTLYVAHIEPALAHARHYIGWTERAAEARWDEHVTGKGSPLIRAAIAAGRVVTWAVVGTGTRHDERRMHNRKNGAAFCPTCKGAPRA